MRVTHAMLNRQLLASASQSYERMAGIDLYQRVSTVSDDPAAAQRMIQIRQTLSRNKQYQSNVETGQRWLLSADSALTTLTDVYDNVRALALSAADGSMEMDSEGILASLDAAIEQILATANTQVGNSYLFGGSRLETAPFEVLDGAVVYRGDDHTLSAPISSGLSLGYNLPGGEVFAPLQAELQGTLDWDPILLWETPIDALRDGMGVELGEILITLGSGQSATVDLSSARTLGEVRDLLQAEFPDLRVEIVDGEKLSIESEGPLSIEDVQGGVTAQILGIGGTAQDGSVSSRDLDPALTEDTLLADLRGIHLPLQSISVTMGEDGEPEKLDLSTATTVGEVMEMVHEAFPQLVAGIADSGSRLVIHSQGYEAFTIANAGEDDLTAHFLGMEGHAAPNRPLELLYELREAVENQDSESVQNLLSELESVQHRITEIHGRVGSRLSLAEDSLSNLESRNAVMTETLSKLGDADLSETLMLYQNAEASYQASLMLASKIYQLTLANFL